MKLLKYKFDFVFRSEFFFICSHNWMCVLFTFCLFVLELRDLMLCRFEDGVVSLIVFSQRMAGQLMSLFGRNFLTRYNSAFFVELSVIGLGFRIAKSRFFPRMFKLYLGHAHWIYLFSSDNLVIRARRKSLFLFSANRVALLDFLSQLLVLRKLNPYKVKGLVRPHMFLIGKSSKQR